MQQYRDDPAPAYMALVDSKILSAEVSTLLIGKN